MPMKEYVLSPVSFSWMENGMSVKLVAVTRERLLQGRKAESAHGTSYPLDSRTESPPGAKSGRTRR